QLRRKRYFQHMTQIGDALIRNGIDAPQIRRQYAQGLIDSTQGLTDTGSMTAALCILQGIVSHNGNAEEVAEARTLIGRVHKQLYMNAATANCSPLTELQQALQAYYSVYASNRKYYLWQGMGAAALLARAERDGRPQRGFPHYQRIAREVLANLNVTDAD